MGNAVWNVHSQSKAVVHLTSKLAVMFKFFRSKPPSQRLKTILVWLFIAMLAVLAQLPRRLRLQFGSVIGRVFYLTNKKRRQIALINLELCFPHWPVQKRRQVAYDHFILYGQAIIDLGMVAMSSEERLNRLMNIKGIEHYRRARNAQHAVILLTPHLVGVDFAGTLLARNMPICSMMRDQKISVLNNRMKANRTRFGLRLYTRSQGLLPLVRDLKRKISCYYIADEDFGTSNSLFVSFFGVPVATLNTLGRMTRMTDAKVLPVRTYLDPRSGQYHVTIEPPMANFPTDSDYINARRMNSVFETIIQAAPEQYLWTLRWFKTRPGNEEPIY